MANKFKVGDRVRYVHDGSFGTVDGFNVGTIRVKCDDPAYGICTEVAEDIELIQPTASASPAIRTVTRREIVPGVYGRVEIFQSYADGDVLLKVEDASRGIAYIDGHYLNASELRETAHLFNQIAEVLEENAALEMKEAA